MIPSSSATLPQRSFIPAFSLFTLAIKVKRQYSNDMIMCYHDLTQESNNLYFILLKNMKKCNKENRPREKQQQRLSNRVHIS